MTGPAQPEPDTDPLAPDVPAHVTATVRRKAQVDAEMEKQLDDE
jgi:hypothetical protein